MSYLDEESGRCHPRSVVAELHVQGERGVGVGQVLDLQRLRKVCLRVQIEIDVVIAGVPVHIVEEIPEPGLGHARIDIGAVLQLLEDVFDPVLEGDGRKVQVGPGEQDVDGEGVFLARKKDFF